jgi:lathosterol oxidase
LLLASLQLAAASQAPAASVIELAGVDSIWPSYTWSNATDDTTLEPFSKLVFPISSEDMNPYRNFNVYLNSFLFSTAAAAWFVETFGAFNGHFVMCYCRNFVAGGLIYYLTAFAFYYYSNIHSRSDKIFENRTRPSRAIIIDQIMLAQASLFVYVGLPVFTDYVIEEGYTQAYYEIKDIGGMVFYLPLTLFYFACVEVGIYWMHRTLHTNKTLYKYIHGTHHKYNSAETLTPFASIAFNPLDGILQASPYVILLFFIPCHYLTHVIMVFCTAIWATFIHDAMDADIEPIMSNKYHTVHHTHYHYNFGQVFIYCDQFFGTLKKPDAPTGSKRKGAKKVN